MDGVENNVQGGVCGEDTGRSSQGRRVQTLWWFCSKRTKLLAALKREHSFCCTSPTDKSDSGFNQGISRQNCHSRNTSSRQGRPNCGIISEPSNINRHSGGATKKDQVSVRTCKSYEKERYSDLQHRHDGRRKYDRKRVPTLCCGWTFSTAQE